MDDLHSSGKVFKEAVALAGRAPSLFNVQPWKWQFGVSSLHLELDLSRALSATDPTNRELTVSCGAALHHAVLALKTRGWQVQVHRIPDPATPQKLATIDVVAHAEPSDTEIALTQAACVRHSDRRQYAPDPVSAAVLRSLVEVGEQAGADVVVAEDDHRYALAQAFAKAAFIHGASAEYRRELAAWTGFSSAGTQGMAKENAPPPGGQYGDLVMRDFGRVAITHGEVGSSRTAGSLLLVSTPTDDPLAHLKACEATSAMLCTAEVAGLASSPLGEAFEIEETRAAVRREVLGDASYPQLALWVGWPSELRKPPATPRRPVDELLREIANIQPSD
ncbi:Acg family FMN-binding oxidoreductase [Saccharopolyspora pogona]|uniref:Acg family FMN-binding oxidoreductase n=1 Tax=Saccharopolyspora pogona TaxID=333966 RepID=UPI0016821323|nr:hypothetical protein [Saccharopolyspora pogona]